MLGSQARGSGLWNTDCRAMTAAETEFWLSIMVYGLATMSSLVVGYLAYRKIRPHRPGERYHAYRDEQPKRV